MTEPILIPIAVDDDGSILYRSNIATSASTAKFSLHEKNGVVHMIHFYRDDASVISSRGSHRHIPFPLPWIRWILVELFDVDLSTYKDVDLQGLVPEILPYDWETMEQMERDLIPRSLIESLEGQKRDPQAMRVANREIKALLDLIYGEHVINQPNAALSVIGEWILGVATANRPKVSVYRQAQPDGSVRVAFWGFDKDMNISKGKGYTLVDALRNSGFWITTSEFDVWLDANTVDPIWIVDPVLLEPYSLVNKPNPLIWEWGKLLTWAKELDLEVEY